MKNFIKEIGKYILRFTEKLTSFKNIVFLFSTYILHKSAVELEATFMHFMIGFLILIVLFYTSNQFQKWLFGKMVDKV